MAQGMPRQRTGVVPIVYNNGSIHNDERYAYRKLFWILSSCRRLYSIWIENYYVGLHTIS